MRAPPSGALEQLVKAEALRLGFDLVGLCTLGPAQTGDQFTEWLDRGYDGEMAYLARNADARRDSRKPVPGTTSAVVVALNYGGTALTGPIARYARGADYHDVMAEKLHSLHMWLAEHVGHPVRGRAYVDTGPVLERDLARRAGLGWFGKNTNLLNPTLGSFFFLGALFVEIDLVPDAPFEADRCGTCTRCLDACPTDALIADHVLDATRCISYLTIELRGPIPAQLREGVGELIYGCDICQDVCPWNVRFARDVREPALAPRSDVATLRPQEVLGLTDADFQTRFRKSPIKRAKRRGLARNAAVAIGNRGDPADVAVLSQALTSDADPLVRGHAAWALGAIAKRYVAAAEDVRTVLESAHIQEADATVVAEIAAARDALHEKTACEITRATSSAERA